ncbi:von Willebrand factor A domain-containing protein 7-like [Clarias gariepinus]
MITTNRPIKFLICLHLTIFLISHTLAFMALLPDAQTHQNITLNAILQTTADVCKSMGKVAANPLTVESVAEACYSSNAAKDFQRSINEINTYNALVDIQYPFTASYHFNNEEFLSGQDLILKGISTVITYVSQENYQVAREALGKVFHTLQDFYSHSNWIELGHTTPYSSLIQAESLISNMADSDTCSSCYFDICRGNILEAVITQQKLTSGYYGETKPKGKCSHGGNDDVSSWGQGGINKDNTSSSHGYLHEIAASVATDATIDLLNYIRKKIGDSEFLRLLGLGQTAVLCFVIDTTSSMSDNVASLRKVTSAIIDSKTGSAIKPLEYILVLFNDPGYGPLLRTSDPKVFKDAINALIPSGGENDDEEMCLSGLKLALTGCPPQTEIYVFTDAGAKDKWLTNSVKALIEKKKSVVTFMLNGATSSLRRRKRYWFYPGQQSLSPQLSDPQLYQDLAQASGGYVVDVNSITQSNIQAVTSSYTMVTLFQAVIDPPTAEIFSVFVDFSVQSLTIYITGNPNYSILSPTGVLQNSTALSNMSVWPTQIFGNLSVVQPDEKNQAGRWLFNINSTEPYSIKVTGRSIINFLFDFVQIYEGLHTTYTELNRRPVSNTSINMLLSLLGGSNKVKATEVYLTKSSSPKSYKGTLKAIGNGQYMVSFNSVSAGQFAIFVIGEARFVADVILRYQRQSPSWFQVSDVTVAAQPFEHLEPGVSFSLPFNVTANSFEGNFNISVTNDQNFDILFNKSITLKNGVSANETVTVIPPVNASSGTEAIMTIFAEAANGSDFNYAVLHLDVIDVVREYVPPVCNVLQITANCSGSCSLSSWSLTANVTAGFGSGIPSLKVLKGNGQITTTSMIRDTSTIVTMVVYNASCCSKELHLVAVDSVGNVATCFRSLSAAAAPSTLPHSAEFFLICLLLNIGVSLYQHTQL